MKMPSKAELGDLINCNLLQNITLLRSVRTLLLLHRKFRRTDFEFNLRMLVAAVRLFRCRQKGLLVIMKTSETWLLTLRKERKLRVFENMVLRRIFGPRRDEVRG